MRRSANVTLTMIETKSDQDIANILIQNGITVCASPARAQSPQNAARVDPGQMSGPLSSTSIFVFEVILLGEALAFFDGTCEIKLVCKFQPCLSSTEICFPCLWKFGDLGQPYAFERISATLFGIGH